MSNSTSTSTTTSNPAVSTDATSVSTDAVPATIVAPMPTDPNVTRILGGLYLGGIQPIVDHTPLSAQFKISHILSIIKFQVIPEYLVRKGYTLKNIPIDDDHTTDILQYFNETNSFIDSCLFPNEKEYDPRIVNFKKKQQNGAIYVHCHAGVSRSATFMIAYLMYRYGLSLKNSIYAIKRKLPKIEPNENFMEQLEIFSRMGGQYVDFENQEYKSWKLKNSIKLDPTGDSILSKDETFKMDQDEEKDLAKMTPEELGKVTTVRCKKCRQRLALSTSFIKHDPPSRESSEGHFIKRAAGSRRIIDIQESQSQCSHFFTEPLNWMKDELRGKQELEGKFSCPGCNSKVGGYNWKGSRCSCGKWVIPAIHLQANKVDQFPLNQKALPNLIHFKSKDGN
ncbi:tyrosine protein phosphatase YVH1 NDAI_0G04420 [Naumovozyma dairenensis CBS 421]|uniref:protein-tyrosine-phosphatase n=1 Tax=Naumovozyma dairenensis (strain ATCC 10597 / BCRC 20456 / CBS 421 / NBRC 0211 / NRRL Y-12639) TaxID=1071378 RepID=J7RT92_NAUDC|nr:hypothetical protein NDAI_0G04420 [Naumovozyma dairenensis CBS 421]CCK73427.1 hypothetical protein NDAI_0G04420 [Naumovozyma dairenensis CBS 421]